MEFYYPQWRKKVKKGSDKVMISGFEFDRGMCQLDIIEGALLNPFYVGNARILMRHLGAQEIGG